IGWEVVEPAYRCERIVVHQCADRPTGMNQRLDEVGAYKATRTGYKNALGCHRSPGPPENGSRAFTSTSTVVNDAGLTAFRAIARSTKWTDDVRLDRLSTFGLRPSIVRPTD